LERASSSGERGTDEGLLEVHMKPDELPTAIRDDLLAVGEVEIEQVHRYGKATVIFYVLDTVKRVACYIGEEVPAEFDLVVDVNAEEVEAFEVL
jgi:hypothetical protein